MKKAFIFLMFLLFTVNAFSQTTPSNEFSKDYYLQRSKKQKTTGWILLSGGTVMTVVGLIGFSDNWHNGSYSTTDAYGCVILGGIVSGLGSIPLFILSRNNARKAATISFNNILVPKQGLIIQNSQPTVSLKITF